MYKSVCILGRQPALGLAELESLYGSQTLQPVGTHAVLLANPPDEVDFLRLGGSVKLGKLLTTLPYTDWNKLIKYIVDTLPGHLAYFPEGKLTIGLSAYGFSVSATQVGKSALAIKKVVRGSGRSVRIVPNTQAELSSAQVLHNKLTRETGLELLLVRDGKQTILAQTSNVQDINAYAARDQKRPKRDAKVGMLPPKLAQIIINLAIGQIEGKGLRVKGKVKDELDSTLHPTPYTLTVLDPFCGTGVVLQEALLMGYKVHGSDVDPRMIEYSQANLEWLHQRFKASGNFLLEVGDATNHTWQGFDAVASELFLGKPLFKLPSSEVLGHIIHVVDGILEEFLRNIAKQSKPGARLCLAVPAWHENHGFRHLPVIDHLAELGYNRLSFVHANNDDLIYFRENQIVARELLVLVRK